MPKGSCLCSKVRFEVAGDLPRPVACHCTKYREHTGHFEASVDVPRSALSVEGEGNLTWFRSSENVRRGFCSTRGASLFFDPLGADWTAVSMGAFDGPTDTSLERHLFVADKGDHYEIGDGPPQNQQ